MNTLADTARLCRGTLTPLPVYLWNMAERFAAGANEQVGAVADTGKIFVRLKVAVQGWALDNDPSELAEWVFEQIGKSAWDESPPEKGE